jgi:dephospho-CoA kinase
VQRVGLTGGIGSGKSTVARRLAALGALVIDSDVLAREVVEPGTPGLAAIREAFGPGVIKRDGSLDRPALGRIVFADRGRLDELNAIVHPLVRERAAAIMHEARPSAVVVQDVPLLVESDYAGSFDLVVVVDAPDEERIARLAAERGMTAEDVRARMGAQASREERLAAADVVLDNSGSREQLMTQVDRLWEQLSEGPLTVEA